MNDVSAPALPVASVLRLIVVAIILVAVVATSVETASRTTVNPFNFFGYFTVLSNLLLAAVFLVVVLAMPWQSSEPSTHDGRRADCPVGSKRHTDALREGGYGHDGDDGANRCADAGRRGFPIVRVHVGVGAVDGYFRVAVGVPFLRPGKPCL